MQEYNAFEYLWPPRPENAIPPEMLRFYQKRGYIGQIKKNGTCSVIFVSPDKQVTAMNRHNEPHKAWQFTDASREAFTKVPGDGWYVFCAELLHNKGGDPRDTNYIFDMLVCNGQYLVGITQQERYNMLLWQFNITDETDHYHIVNTNTWIANPLEGNFREIWDNLTNVQDEGIVLKKPDAVLEFCRSSGANAGSMVKCRKNHKNFSF